MVDCSFIKQLVDIHGFSSAEVKDICDHLVNLICSDVLLNLKSGENEVRIDIGFGYLIIRSFQDKILYQFEPSEELKSRMEKTVTERNDPLAAELKLKIDKKLQQLYKELLK